MAPSAEADATPDPEAADPAPLRRTCAGPDCSTEFEQQRSTARYCSATCRQRAARARKVAAAAAAEPPKPERAAPVETSLIAAVERDLERARATESVAGQLALALARRISDPDESGITAMVKELRSLVAEALALAPAGSASAVAELDDDEVAKAREARDRKRAALGQEADRA